MNYLTSLHFSNFQSLANTALEDISQGFVCIIGQSNLGKSAALRAIKALMRNAPAPGLVREGTKQFDIEACFSDGTTVHLTKGKNKSVFVVNGEEYAKSGVKAPEEVLELWSMPAPDGRELAFATQHETPFLLDEPASAVAKVLGDLTNANALMEAVQKANRLRTEALNDAKARTREAEEARNEILLHKGLSTKEKTLQAVREQLRAVKDLFKNKDELENLLREKINIDQEMSELPQHQEIDILEAEQAVVDASNLEELIVERAGTNMDFQYSCLAIMNLEEQIQDIEDEINSILEESGVCPLCSQKIGD